MSWYLFFFCFFVIPQCIVALTSTYIPPWAHPYTTCSCPIILHHFHVIRWFNKYYKSCSSPVGYQQLWWYFWQNSSHKHISQKCDWSPCLTRSLEPENCHMCDETHTTKQECGATHFTWYIFLQNIINCMNQSLAMSGEPKVGHKWPCLQYFENIYAKYIHY